MPTSESVRSRLRSATEPFHERVDQVFSRADLGQRETYGRLLLAQAAAHLAVEDALTRAGAAEVLADWPERQREALLRADLAALGLAVPAGGPAPRFEDPAAILGGVYVLEGSRLGGRMLKRQVPQHLPSSFLGAGDSAAWRDLLGILDDRLADDAAMTAAIASAVAVFAIFEDSGKRFLAG